jgi:hypothetical protein
MGNLQVLHGTLTCIHPYLLLLYQEPWAVDALPAQLASTALLCDIDAFCAVL